MEQSRKCDCSLSNSCQYYQERRDDTGHISKVCTYYCNIGYREMDATKVQACPIKMY